MDAADFAKQGLGYLIATLLAGVVFYQNKRIEALYKEKDDLQERRLAGTQTTIDKYNAAMGDFSQTTKLLLAKLDGKEEK